MGFLYIYIIELNCIIDVRQVLTSEKASFHKAIFHTPTPNPNNSNRERYPAFQNPGKTPTSKKTKVLLLE
jgi:hypothetical protein